MSAGPILRAMRRNKVRYGLLVVEVALTLAIVANCVQLALGTRAKLARTSGFDDASLLQVRAVPFDPSFRQDSRSDQVLSADLAALRRLPGVKAVTNTRFLPWQGGGSSTELRPAGSRAEPTRTQTYPGDEALVEALGTSLVEGRTFTRDDVERETVLLRDLPQTRDREPGGRVRAPITQSVVVSRAYARLVFPGSSPVGRLLEDADGDQYRIVGVIDRFYNPYGWPIGDYAVFYAQKSASYDFGAPFLVRSEPGRRDEVVRAIEKALLSVDPGRVVTVRTVQAVRERYEGADRLVVTSLGLVVALLLFVTCLGVVGVTSFSVAERTRQIGTRRALGATRGDILRHFLLENGLVTALGVVLGVGATVGLNIALVHQAGAARLRPELLLGASLLLLGAGLLATLAPALRGSRVAPAVATRNV